MPRSLWLVATTLVLLVGLTACSGDDSDSAPDERDIAVPGAPSFDGKEGDAADPGVTPGDPSAGRFVIRTAYLELEVDDGARAVAAIEAETAAIGGYVASTWLSRGADGTVAGTITVRVPAERLNDFVATLDGLARAVPTRNLDEFDVTTELRDLEAELVNLRAYERELRALLTEVRERGGEAEGLLAVSDRLRQIRTEIDRTEGRRTQIADQVTLSTVTISVRPTRSATPVVGSWDLAATARDALAATVRAAQFVVELAVWAALTLLPLVLGLGIVVFVIRRLAGRRRRGDDHVGE